MSIPLSGSIQASPLSDILEQLRQKKATGALTLSSEGTVKRLYLKDGQIIFATSSESHDRLGEILVKAGKLSQDHLDQALKLYKKSGGFKKIGAILVENGLITPKELFSGLKMQVKDIIFSLFLWREGEYVFEERLPSDVIQLQINFEELIPEIIRRIKLET